MNIFYINENPIIAAQQMVDRHVVKMILESCQLLSTAHRMLDGTPYVGKTKTNRNVKRWKLLDAREPVVYQATHINHPSAIWCRTSVQNYNWLVEHMYALMDEYTYRYNKKHKCMGVAYYLQSPPKNLQEYDQTPIICAMDKQYIISDDPLTNYRNYYKIGKKDLHTWTKRTPPEWI
jgi:hypothetical protein